MRRFSFPSSWKYFVRRTHQIAHVAYLGICCSALGYLFYAIALDRLGASRSTVYINLIPLVTVSAEFVLGKPLALEQLAGGAVIVLGVMLATLGGGARPAVTEPR